MSGSDPTDRSPAPLPPAAAGMAAEQPALWQAYQQLGVAVADAGPLDARTRRLVGLAYAIAGDSEGATHSHARRGLAEGLSAAELEHVPMLAVTTLGWPLAMKGIAWVRDVTRPKAIG